MKQQITMAGRTDDGTIIPVSQPGKAGRKFPHLLDAISQIQQLYMIESTGQYISSDFLTLRGQLNYFSVGYGHGFLEGLVFLCITIVLIPIMDNPSWYRKLVSVIPFFEYKWFAYLVEYLPVIINAGLCSFLGKYYIGNITKKAINSLLMGRIFSLIMKALLYFVGLIWIAKHITPELAEKLASIRFLGSYDELYTFLVVFKQSLIKTAFLSFFVFTLAALTPFVFVWGIAWWRSYKASRDARKLRI